MKLIIELPDDSVNDIIESTYPNDRLIGEAIYAIKNGIPWEDIKVEIQNTILEQVYNKGYEDAMKENSDEHN